MKPVILQFIALVAAANLALPQTFEVASIRPSGPHSVRGSTGGPGTKDPGRYTFNGACLEDLIVVAYDIKEFQIASRIPLDREDIDLAANVPSGATKEQFRIMLRNLLAERFHLKIHMISKEFPGYELVVAKSGSKLKEASLPAPPAPREWLNDGFPDLSLNRPGMIANNSLAHPGSMLTRIKAQQEPLKLLADFLRTSAQQPIADKTGLAGKFDFTLEFSAEIPNAASIPNAEPAAAPDLNTALREQLGLQLVKKKLLFDVVVVDAVEQVPTSN